MSILTLFWIQVVLHTELERILPTIILKNVDKNELIEFPNKKKCKLGFLDLILRKWFCNPFSDDGMYYINNIPNMFTISKYSNFVNLSDDNLKENRTLI